MERNNRPLSRKKNVTGGTMHVGRRPGAQGGPQGNGGFNMGGQHSGPQGMPTGEFNGGGMRRGGGFGSPLLVIIALLFVLLGGGKMFSSGQSGYGGYAPSNTQGQQTSSQSSSSFGLGDILGQLLGASGGGYTPSYTNTHMDTYTGGSQYDSSVYDAYNQYYSGVELDTTVADEARNKRTVIKGNGKDINTIMVYMCGTDLESNGGYASKDIQEMLAANISDNINLLIFTGGCKRWQNNVMDSKKNQIFKVENGGLKLLSESNKLLPMTDPDTLSAFIKWTKKNYPADRYDLIFWDHGGGSTSGYGYDEVNKMAGSMTLDKIDKALKDGGVEFDFVGFDACLMATLETALVTEQYADYMIASEEAEPGCGWYYTDWLKSLSKDPSMSTINIGKNIVDGFVTTCEKVTPRQPATLSLIDLAELKGTVPDIFSAFSQATSKAIEDNGYMSVATARANTKEFGAGNKIDQIDLIQFTEKLKFKEGEKLSKALDGAIKYNRTSRNIQNANGISIYFPYSKKSTVSTMAATYKKIGLDDSYTQCIKDFASVETAGQAVYGGNETQMTSLFDMLTGTPGGSYTGQASSQGSQGGYTTISSEELIADILGSILSGRSMPEVGLTEDESSFINEDVVKANQKYIAVNQFDAANLFWQEKNGKDVLSLSENQWALIENIELNVFVDDGNGYYDLGFDNVFDFDDEGNLLRDYDKTWLAINGQPIAYYMISSEGTSDDYKIMGRIPAYLNGEKVYLIACFTDEVENGEILGAMKWYDPETETETMAKGLMDVVNGDEILFISDYYTYNKELMADYPITGEPLIVNGELKISNIVMDNEGFIASYRFTDIYDNAYWLGI